MLKGTKKEIISILGHEQRSSYGSLGIRLAVGRAESALGIRLIMDLVGAGYNQNPCISLSHSGAQGWVQNDEVQGCCGCVKNVCFSCSWADMLHIDTNYTLHTCMCVTCMAAHTSTLHIYPFIPACPCQSPHDLTLHIYLHMHTYMHAHVYVSLTLCTSYVPLHICVPMCMSVLTPSTALCSLLASVVGSFHFIYFIADSN